MPEVLLLWPWAVALLMAQTRSKMIEEAFERTLGQIRDEYEESVKWTIWLTDASTPVGGMVFVGMLYGLLLLALACYMTPFLR